MTADKILNTLNGVYNTDDARDVLRYIRDAIMELYTIIGTDYEDIDNDDISEYLLYICQTIENKINE